MSVPNRISIALCTLYSKNNRNAIKYMHKEGGGLGYHMVFKRRKWG